MYIDTCERTILIFSIRIVKHFLSEECVYKTNFIHLQILYEDKVRGALRATGDIANQEKLDALVCLAVDKEKLAMENENAKKVRNFLGVLCFFRLDLDKLTRWKYHILRSNAQSLKFARVISFRFDVQLCFSLFRIYCAL